MKITNYNSLNLNLILLLVIGLIFSNKCFSLNTETLHSKTTSIGNYVPQPNSSALAVIDGEFKRYHKLSLTWDAVTTFSETDVTFQDYRLNVTFTSPSGKVYLVPGFFAADGNATETSSNSGSKWRCNFIPLEVGTWSYSASFRNGSMITTSFDPLEGVAVAPMDGDSGSFSIIDTDKSGIDLRAKGKLEYVGEHFMRWSDGTYFLKIGSDSPEVLLEYNDIDDYDGANFPRTYANHVGDWNTGDPTWQGGKGKGLIGIINYLSGKGINSQYFVLHRQDERGSPFSNVPNSYYSYDISRLGQWEVVFDHMVQKGLNVHLVLSESTNQSFFEIDVPSGDPLFSDARKIYYREMVARFGYLNGVTWNIGEENGWDRKNTWAGPPGRALTTQQQLNFTAYLDNLAYYNDFITVHNGHANDTGIYDVLQGNNSITGTSMQGVLYDNNRSKYSTQQYREESAASGKKWVVYYDEAWYHNDYELIDFRRNVLWSAFTAGSAGIEHYATNGLDVTMEDLRFYDGYYTQMKHAYDFYHQNNLPFYEMYNQDELIENGWVHGTNGDDYVIYVEENNVGATTMRLMGDFQIKWFNPRAGGALLDGTITNLTAGEAVNIGLPPYETNLDWVALVRTDPNNGPISVNQIIVEPTNLELGVGSSYDLRAQVLPSNADDLSVTWSSSDSSIVTVDNQGNVLATGVGVAIVTVTTNDGGHTAQTTINVIDSSNFCVASGSILMERYDGVPGYNISDLLNHMNYPDNSTVTQELSEFQIPSGVGNNYGARVSGLLCAPETGFYTFWISGDDKTQLNLSTDDQPANAVTIAYNDQYTNIQEWNKISTQKSIEIELMQGQKYYIEALMKEGSGGDHMAVGWRKPSDRAGDSPEEVVPGSVLTSAIETPVGGVALSPAIVNIELAERAQLVVEIQPAFATNRNVTWISDNNAIVTVDSFGNIEGATPGTAKITVTTEDGGFTAETTVNVTSAAIPVTGVTIDATNVNIEVSEVLALNATVQPTNADNQNVVWVSNNESVVLVDDNGNIIGVAEGSAVITITTEDGSFTAETRVNVTSAAIPVTGVTIDYDEIVINEQELLLLNVEFQPSNATNQSVLWSSDDLSIATVDEEGNVLGISPGTTIVRATSVDGGYQSQTTVTVLVQNISVSSVAVSLENIEVVVGQETQIFAGIQPSNASDQSVQWSSDDTNIVTIDSDGNITGISPGVATVHVTTIDGGHIDFAVVTVLAQTISVTGITSISEVEIEIGEQLQIVAEIQPSNASNQTIVWASDDPSIVTVDSNGSIVAIAAGVTSVSATTVNGGYVAETVVTVTDGKIQVTGISIDPISAEIVIGKKLQVFAEITPANATNQLIIWSSQNENIAVVDEEGLISGLEMGSTIIFATTADGSFEAQITIIVNEAADALSEISLDYNSIDLEVGQTITLNPTVLPENANDTSFIWTTSDSSIASVDSDGNILGVAAGTSTVRISTVNGELFAEIEIVVTAEQILSIYPNPASDYIMVNGVNELIFVSIFTSDGKILQRIRTKTGSTKINIGHLPPAIYFIGLDSGRKIPFIKR